MWQLVNPGIQLATLPKRSSTISETHVGHGKAGWLEEDGFLPLASFSSPLQPITFQAKYRPAPGRTGELGHRSEAPGAKTKTKSRGVPDPPNLPLPPDQVPCFLPSPSFFPIPSLARFHTSLSHLHPSCSSYPSPNSELRRFRRRLLTRKAAWPRACAESLALTPGTYVLVRTCSSPARARSLARCVCVCDSAALNPPACFSSAAARERPNPLTPLACHAT